MGVNYDALPQALLDAALEEDLPLLEVPRRTPFLAISKAVSAALAADQYRAVTAGFEAQRELTRAALAEGPDAVVARLAAHVDGWAALYDASGAVVAAAPDWAARRAARLAPDVQRLRERAAPATAVVGGTDDRVELQSLGTGRRVRGALAVGTGAPLGTAERYAVHSAIALLTLTTERSRSLQAAEQRLGAAVLRMLLAGQPDHARTVAGELYGGLLDALVPAGRRRGRERPGPGGRTAARLPRGHPRNRRRACGRGRAGRARGRRPAGGPGGGRGSGGRRLRGVRGEGRGGGRGVPRALRPHRADSRGGRVQAGRAGPLGGPPPGRTLVEHEELAAGSLLPLLADDAVRAFADGMLRALYEHDATGRGDLVASLRAWLSRHGQWDAAAADLGVHRHTLRYRMRRVEEILGRSLDDPDVRMELWLALKATGDQPPAP